MTITQTVDIPADHRLIVDVPREIPAGRTTLSYTPAPVADTGECPLCAISHTPNAQTAAAIREGRAMMRGEVPAKFYDSLDEMWNDIVKDEPND